MNQFDVYFASVKYEDGSGEKERPIIIWNI